MEDLRKLGVILHGAVSVPISSDASPFILPSYTEAVLTSLQEAVLTALDVLQKVGSRKQFTSDVHIVSKQNMASEEEFQEFNINQHIMEHTKSKEPVEKWIVGRA